MTQETTDGRPSIGRRLAAAGLDYLVILAWIAMVVVLGLTVRAVLPGVIESIFDHPVTGELAGFALLTLPVAAYLVRSEASPSGASWGKRRTGLRVAGDDGRGIGLGRSSVRTAVKLLPWELSHFAVWQLSAGPTVAGFVPYVALGAVWFLVGATLAAVLATRQRRAVHDLVAGTRVFDARRTHGTPRHPGR